MRYDYKFIVDIPSGKVREFNGNRATLPGPSELFIGMLIDPHCKKCYGQGNMGLAVASKNLRADDPAFCKCISKRWAELSGKDKEAQQALDKLKEDLIGGEPDWKTPVKPLNTSKNFLVSGFRYLGFLIKHRWLVMVECFKLGIPFLGLIHDLSNFSPQEWFPYVDRFFGTPKGETDRMLKAQRYEMALHLHHLHNKHHWEHWVIPYCPVNPFGSVDDYHKALEMPPRYVKEMIADWIGSGKALRFDGYLARRWYLDNLKEIRLHPNTRKLVEDILFNGKICPDSLRK